MLLLQWGGSQCIGYSSVVNVVTMDTRLSTIIISMRTIRRQSMHWQGQHLGRCLYVTVLITPHKNISFVSNSMIYKYHTQKLTLKNIKKMSCSQIWHEWPFPHMSCSQSKWFKKGKHTTIKYICYKHFDPDKFSGDLNKMPVYLRHLWWHWQHSWYVHMLPKKCIR